MKVMFVCHGNTCRSPMAEAILKSLVEDIEVTSAGISAIPNEKAAYNAIRVCSDNGMDLKNHKSKNISDLDINDYDLILTVTCDIRDSLKKSNPDLEIYTIKEYAGETEYLDIRDPIGGDLFTYETCFLEIKDALDEIIINKKI